VNWTDLRICVWDGPECLRKTPCLRDFYPEHQKLFSETLGIANTTWATLMEEAGHIEATDSLEYISQVFVAISGHLKTEGEAIVTTADNRAVLTLTQSRIFPIETKKTGFAFDLLSTARESDMWFIADRWHLRQSFEGLVPLLALDVGFVEKIHTLIQTLRLEGRLLSNVSHGIPKTVGACKLHTQYTISLRAKSRLIARYVTFLNPPPPQKAFM